MKKTTASPPPPLVLFLSLQLLLLTTKTTVLGDEALDELLTQSSERLQFRMNAGTSGREAAQLPDMTFREPFFRRETKNWDDEIKKHPKRGYGASWVRYYGINPTDAEVWKRYYEGLEWAPRIRAMRYLARQDMGQIAKLTRYLKSATKEQRDRLTEFLMETRDYGARHVEGQDQIDYFLANQETAGIKPWKPVPPRMVLGQLPGIKVVPVFAQVAEDEEDDDDDGIKRWQRARLLRNDDDDGK